MLKMATNHAQLSEWTIIETWRQKTLSDYKASSLDTMIETRSTQAKAWNAAKSKRQQNCMA